MKTHVFSHSRHDRTFPHRQVNDPVEYAATILPLPAFPAGRGSREPAAFDLSVVIPAYNEVRRLPATLDRLSTWTAALPWQVELIVVDDGSGDATVDLAVDHPCRCGVIRLLRNAGKGAAVRAGMLEARGRVVAFTDADLPYRMEALEHAYDSIEAGRAEVVYGARDLPESAAMVRRAAHRSLASAAYRLLMGMVISRQVRDTQCGLKAFSRHAAREVFQRVHTDGFAFDAEAILVARRLGLATALVPVVLVNEAGSTVSLRRHAPRMLRDIVRSKLRHARGAGPRLTAMPDYEVLRTAVPGVDRIRRAA
jgi:dolichyl-phosphate beta-glucosyltransferase